MTEPIVTLPDGSIKGRWRSDTNGQKFFSFEGIPYGDPPIGELRFKDPVPVKPWTGVKDCTKLGPGSLCHQPRITKNSGNEGVSKEFVLDGSEDCLNLNVYTRQLKSPSSKPQSVMFFIHGGAYIMGNTHPYGPERLLTQDIVLVQLHYRMGAFGFLAMADPELGISGNAAMKDTILALKWVQRNITIFNGDPKNVTIFGHSAGGTSIAFLILSQAVLGLFHKAIIQSCALTNALRGYGPNAEKLAKALSCKETDERKILEYLQSLPAERICEGQYKLRETWHPCNMRIFSPVVESRSNKDPFLADEPVELLKTGRYYQIPTMIGYAEMESISLMELGEKDPFNIRCFEEDTLTPVWFGFQRGTKEFQTVAKKIKKFYYGDSDPEFYSLPTVNMNSDMTVIRDVIRITKYFAETSKKSTFLYRISIPDEHSEIFSSKNLNGATHGAELPYLFKMCEITDDATQTIAQRILKLWTNFAKYGNPTAQKDHVLSVDWKPVTKEHLNYLDIGESLTLKEDPESDRMAFWDQLYQSYPQSKDY